MTTNKEHHMQSTPAPTIDISEAEGVPTAEQLLA